MKPTIVLLILLAVKNAFSQQKAKYNQQLFLQKIKLFSFTHLLITPIKY